MEDHLIAAKANTIFEEAIQAYKNGDGVNQPFSNPYVADEDALAHLLYRKCWIDANQWALEDIIRDPNIDPEQALKIKREIDASNQDRTDTVEYLDAYFLDKYAQVELNSSATINTETPAWAIDRLSILALKVYHMRLEASRDDASAEHRRKCKEKLNVLLQQRDDLSAAIDELLVDIAAGRKQMKVYKQMKMYNDAELNPVLRASKK